jgi:RNA 2',3'-cyclic 3'-phosphodiesterase
MRIFFALDLAPATKLAVENWRDTSFGGVAVKGMAHAVPSANFHLTLAFVGEVDEPKLERLCSSVDQALKCSPIQADSFMLNEPGYWQRPGILWLGMRQCPQSLLALATTLQGLGAQVGGKREARKFQPHITLFRNCKRPPPAPLEAPEFRCGYNEFVLMESRQGKRGVSYQGLQYWQLEEGRH